jgi:hypothetical protein
MPSLIGNKPNQVPTNGDLGTMAFREQEQFYATSNNVSMRNRIINGAMTVHQRGGTISATGTVNTYGLDRFAIRTTSGSAVVSMQQSTTAPTGFYNSLLCTVTTADTSLAAGDLTVLHQKIEGVNVSDLGWGTASAQTVTISFRVRSSITGTYGVGVQNDAGNRSYPSSFVINSADTWETKTVTIAGDTTGTWNLGTTSNAIYLWFSLGAGSNYTGGTTNTWNAADNRGTSGQVNWTGTSGATFYITGVQLEAGAQATPFEYRQFGTELALCQRYFETSYDYGQALGATPTNISYTRWSTNGTANALEKWFRVSKRATPTVNTYDTAGNAGKIRIFDGITDANNVTPTAIFGTFNSMWITYNATANGMQFLYTASAEL